MVKKLDELNNPPKDPNSPESQAFLREVHKKSLEHQEKMKRQLEEWSEEDRRNANK
jgi:hypothetical protein